jgi:hypothetical protein
MLIRRAVLPTRRRMPVVPLRLVHRDSGGFVSNFRECLVGKVSVAKPLEALDGTEAFAFGPGHIGLIDCPCLGILVERRGEAASIWFLRVPQTLSIHALRNRNGNQRTLPQLQPSPSEHHAKLTISLQQSASQHMQLFNKILGDEGLN